MAPETRRAAAAALALTTTLLSSCSWLNRKMMYVPSRELVADPSAIRAAFEEVAVRAEDGPVVHGWYVPLASTSPVVLLCHGNGGNISHRLAKLLRLRMAGASVLMFDYRGYGRSTGTPSEQGTYADAEAVYRWLTDERGIAPGRVVFYGESLGCGVAIELATRHPAAGLVVDSGFTSTLAMGKRLFPWLPVSWLLRYRYDNLAKISRVRAPKLFLHSPDDEIVPYAMGRLLFEAATEPKAFFDLRGSHNDGFVQSGRGYVDALSRFFASLVLS